MTDLYAHLREAHPKQQDFIGSPAKRKVIRAGRRSGKTTGVAILGLENFLDYRRVLYATPTQDQIDRFWAECKKALLELTGAGLLYKNETRHIIEIPGTETRIRAKTAWNADSLRGDYADLLILDEFQLMHEDTWDRVGAPMLLDNNGDAVFVYTPPSLHAKARTKADDPQHAAKMFKRAQRDETGRWEAFHFTSHENPYISAEALAEITFDMTMLAIEQEILALDKDEAPGALWTRALLEKTRVSEIPTMLVRVGVGVDPPGGVVECGIIVAGLGANGHGYLFDDRSLQGSPQQWAGEVVAAYNDHDADRVLAEANFGGDMVESTIRAVEGGDMVSFKAVHASRGKAIRAEPVAALYQRGKIHHVGSFPHLEDELCMWMPGSSRSPNRLDAAVWVLTELMLGPTTSMRGLPQDEESKGMFDIDDKEEGPKWRL